ncbi:MAG: hypothetical protein AAFU80_07780 [Pseudomonadota bacterium]
MFRLIPLTFAMLAASVVSAYGAQMRCSGPGVSLNVDVNARAGTCAVDGRKVTLRKAHNPVVCHISNPQLQILTIRPDGSFVYEITHRSQIVRGRCS